MTVCMQNQSERLQKELEQARQEHEEAIRAFEDARKDAIDSWRRVLPPCPSLLSRSRSGPGPVR